jgi:hypothetical protein
MTEFFSFLVMAFIVALCVRQRQSNYPPFSF